MAEQMNTMTQRASITDLMRQLDNGDGAFMPNGMWTQFLLFSGAFTENQLKIRRSKGIPCPLCGGTDRFRYDNRKGTGNWFCSHCGGRSQSGGEANGWSLLSRMVGANEAKDLLREFLEGDASSTRPRPVAVPVPAPVAGPSAEAKQIKKSNDGLWDAGKDFNPTAVPYYTKRGISLSTVQKVKSLKYLPSLGYYVPNPDPAADSDRPIRLDSFPAILASMVDPAGNQVAIHRTWLNADRTGKAVLPEPYSAKKLSRSLGAAGGAIRLFDAAGSTVLGLAEGIETGMAAHELCQLRFFGDELPRDVPVWACYSEGVLRNFEVPADLLPTLKTVVIFADNDESGIGVRAAELLKERLAETHPQLTVLIKVPSVVDCDWLDVLSNQDI